MATYSIEEALERLPAFLQRAAQGEEVIIAGGVGIKASLNALRRTPGPMSPERLAWLDSVRVTPAPAPAPGAPSGPDLVRRMRDEGP
ncbi:hypothetical protein ACE7GA_16685 [Roseomonas sp. CCTCC AB2023176]|uniref:hypothetical protein n=1 Tax=Roseomonas sp. CCTCC AB2023176 TaxID=3342640 RepID=UPI0035D77692